ncbi:hypothetical protein MesoLj113b_72930 (plasmid) [Mesorhizobium sp. 113-3-3]|nr:hypothetical protein MesoLj113b_72930 [Mesorhizobium sp. 113-3-3]
MFGLRSAAETRRRRLYGASSVRVPRRDRAWQVAVRYRGWPGPVDQHGLVFIRVTPASGSAPSYG